MGELIKPMDAQSDTSIPGTVCPIGASAVAVPQQGLRGVELSMHVVYPTCRSDCIFYNEPKKACLLKLAAEKLIS